MLQGDIRQLGRVVGQRIQTQPHAGKHQAALIAALGGDIGDGGGRPHVDHNDRRSVLFQRRHGVGHQIGSQLIVDLHADIQSCLDTGAHHHGRLAQQPGQGFGHHKVDRRHHAGKDGTGDVLQIIAVQCKQIHQVDADLIRRFAAVGVDGGEKQELPRLVKQPHRYVGISNVDRQQHGKSPPCSSSFFLL